LAIKTKTTIDLSLKDEREYRLPSTFGRFSKLGAGAPIGKGYVTSTAAHKAPRLLLKFLGELLYNTIGKGIG
jgi:hypothetical protein